MTDAVVAGAKLWAAGWLIVLLGWGVFGRVGEVALSPGATMAITPLVRVVGRPAATVRISSATTTARPLSPFGWLIATLDPADAVVPEVVGARAGDPGVLSASQQSEVAALVAACRVAGVRVTTLQGQVVRGVLPTSPLRDVVHPGDLVVGVDGVPVPTPAAFASAVAAGVAHTRVTLSLVRTTAAGLSRLVSSVVVPSLAGELGLVTSPATAAITPVHLALRLPDADTASSGLAVSLVIVDELRPALLANAPRQPIAALAGIDPSGALVAVSGLRQRLLAARVAGIQTVIVAASQGAQARADAAGRVRVLAAATLRGALRFLDRLRPVAAARNAR